MPKISLWGSGIKGKNYRTFDRWISQAFVRGGTAVYVHLNLGPFPQDYPLLDIDGNIEPTTTTDPNARSANTSIQDVLFLENRDMQFSKVVYELRGIYNLNDLDFDLRQFGLFLQNDTLFIEFHYNDMISMVGRKIMAGDVLELPHRRDDQININATPLNRFYVVEQAARAAGGYAPNWWPYIWRVKVSPMPASQEYSDLLQQQQTNPYGFLDPTTIGDTISTMGNIMAIDEAIVDQAKKSVSKRYFETQQYWIVLPENPNENPWVFTGDGIPPNGAQLLGTGHAFPLDPDQGSYYLRTDYHPATLFMWDAGKWRMQEQDWRQSDWSGAHRLLLDFINETGTSTYHDGTVAPIKVALSQAVKPRADF